MRYSGSKKRFSKDIVPILMRDINKDTLFIDAFAGGMNIVSEVPHPNKIAIDINKYVIALWREIQKNGMTNIPMDVSEEMYYDIKKSYLDSDNRYPDYIKGYVGNCCSYGGAWWNGYAKFNPKKNENHILEAYNGLKKQAENFKYLKETLFICGDYDTMITQIMTYQEYNKYEKVVYFDPPYADTKKYESDFDNIKFWNNCRYFSENVKSVYTSEYTAPSDFKCIWKKEKKDGMKNTKKGEKQNIKIEKLFIYDK